MSLEPGRQERKNSSPEGDRNSSFTPPHIIHPDEMLRRDDARMHGVGILESQQTNLCRDKPLIELDSDVEADALISYACDDRSSYNPSTLQRSSSPDKGHLQVCKA